MVEGVERAMVVEEVLCVVDTNIPGEGVQVKGEWTLTQLAHSRGPVCSSDIRIDEL
jgi:hypothetical protein